MNYLIKLWGRAIDGGPPKIWNPLKKTNQTNPKAYLTDLEHDTTERTQLYIMSDPNERWIWPLRQTTSVLTTTVLIYTVGAGITAGAGTRLVLQSILS